MIQPRTVPPIEPDRNDLVRQYLQEVQLLVEELEQADEWPTGTLMQLDVVRRHLHAVWGRQVA
jgi:hypothetical protein